MGTLRANLVSTFPSNSFPIHINFRIARQVSEVEYCLPQSCLTSRVLEEMLTPKSSESLALLESADLQALSRPLKRSILLCHWEVYSCGCLKHNIATWKLVIWRRACDLFHPITTGILPSPTSFLLLDWSVQMPFKNLLEDVFPTALDHITVARNYPVKVPTSNLPRTLIETLTVPRTCSVPQESFLPLSSAYCVL